MDSRLLWVELREFDGWLGEDEFIKTRFEVSSFRDSQHKWIMQIERERLWWENKDLSFGLREFKMPKVFKTLREGSTC